MCIYSFTLTHIWLHICSLSCISDKDANKRRRGKKKNSSLIFSSQAGRKSGHSKPWCDRKRRSPDRRISSSTSITMTHVCPTVRDTLRRKRKNEIVCLTVHWWFSTQYLLGLYSNTEINFNSEPAPASGPLPYTSIWSADSSSLYVLPLQLLCADWWLSNIFNFFQNPSSWHASWQRIWEVFQAG